MKEEKPSLILGVGNAFMQHLVFVVFLVCSCVIWLPFIALAESHPKLPLKSIGQGLGFLSLVCSWLFSKGISSNLFADDSMTLKMAFLHTFYGYVGMLSFLPLVGSYFHRFFEEKKAEKNPFREDQAHFHRDSAP
jgi:hypothetical protein